MGKVTLKEETRRREKLLGISAMMYPRTKRQQSPAHLAIRELRQAVRDRRVRGDALKLLGDLAANFDDLVLDYYKHSVRRDHLYPSLSRGGWSNEEGSDRRYEKFELTSQTEQTPDPENRVVLSNFATLWARNCPSSTFAGTTPTRTASGARSKSWSANSPRQASGGSSLRTSTTASG